MIKLSDALTSLVEQNSLLQIGIRHRLLNLTQAAKYLQPLVEARVKKQVQPSAILMALSRLQRTIEARPSQQEAALRFGISNIFINTELCAVTYPNTLGVRRAFQSAYAKIQRDERFITATQGVHELTIILEQRELKALKASISERPIRVVEELASLGLSFDKKYGETPGFLYSIFQQLYLQNLNIVEIASTSGELIIYLREQDVRLAFDTIYNRFGRSLRGNTQRI